MRKLFLTRQGNRILVLVTIGLGAVLFVFSSLDIFQLEKIAPPCLFHQITGLNCPGCGGTRAVSSALRLDFRAAFWYNPLITSLVSAGSVWFLWFAKNAFWGTYRTPFQSRRYLVFCVAFALAAFLFFFLRNTDCYHTLFY